MTDDTTDAQRSDGRGVPVAGATVPRWLDVAGAWSWRLVITAVALLGALSLLTKLYLVTLPVIVALILATICVPPARALEARGLPRSAAAGIVVLGGLASIGGLIALLIPSFVDQILDLRPTIDEGVGDVLRWLEEGPLGYDRQRIEELISQARASASGSSSRIFAGVLTGFSAVAEVVAGLALLVVLLFFFVKDGAQLVDWAIARTPAAQRDTLRATGRRAWAALGGYVRGTATIALIDAVGIGIGLAIIGVPLVLPLATLVFLGGFLPVVGAALAGLVAVLVALAAGGPIQALIALALIIGVQQLEGNVLQPIIMRRAVALHPVVVLVSLTAGATLAGIVGAFLAVPTAAVVSAVGNELRLRGEGEAQSGA
ncbi:MAG: AI-2E family transporter [Actinomycetes bacterium]